MVEITFLGTSSGIPTPSRQASSILIKVRGVGYLFDTGDGCARAILEYEKGFDLIRSIFISHFHPDHFAGLPFLIQGIHLEKRKAQLKIFAPPISPESFYKYLEQNLIFRNRVGFELLFIPICEGRIYSDENIEVNAIRTRHLNKIKSELIDCDENLLSSFGFYIKCLNITICYSSDIESLNDIKDIIKGDILILDGMHIQLEEIPEFIKKNPFNRVILTHIPPQREGLYKSLEPPIEWAYDGMIIKGGQE